MTLDLEDRLRAALAAKAETFTVSPDAWQTTHVRPVPRLAVRRWAAPLAVAAAMVVAVSTTLVVDGGHPTTSPGTARPSPAQPPHGVVPAAPSKFLLQGNPPMGRIARLAAPFGPKRTRFYWAGWGVVDSANNKGKEICDYTVEETGAGAGGCGKYRPLPASERVSMFGGDMWLISEPDRKYIRDPGFYYHSGFGQARAQVAKVTLVLPDGSRLPGAVTSVDKLSDKFWWVVLPPGRPPYVTILFTDAMGRQVAELHEVMKYAHFAPPTPARPRN